MSSRRLCAASALAAFICLASLAEATPNRSFGLRATLVGQGWSAWAYPNSIDGSLLMTQQLIALPAVEALIPAGPGDLLVGVTYGRYALSSEASGGEAKAEQSAGTLGLMAGYAAPLVQAANSTVRAGGRVGTALISEDREFTFRGESQSDDRSPDGFIWLFDGFLAGEHMLSRHVGLQAELGLNYILYSEDEDGTARSLSFLGLYSALSGVIRF